MTSKTRAATRRACDRCCGDTGIAIICQREDQKIPFPRVKGGYCGHGLGSIVNCRHLLSVSWRLVTIGGLNIPCPVEPGIVPGVRSRVVMPPENTVHHGPECRQIDSGFDPMCIRAHKRDVDSDYIGKLQSAFCLEKQAVPEAVFWFYHSCGMQDLPPQAALPIPLSSNSMVQGACGAWCFIWQKGQ